LRAADAARRYDVYRGVRNSMEPVKVGIREFRERLASYVLESDAPVAITRHGDTVGYFIPARRKRSEAERAALKEAAAQLDALLAAKGLKEDDLVAEFKSRRNARRR
jgi:PHD/YefM family antitoxin component YafN of YafNO toxin-antitoxin module